MSEFMRSCAAQTTIISAQEILKKKKIFLKKNFMDLIIKVASLTYTFNSYSHYIIITFDILSLSFTPSLTKYSKIHTG